MPRTDDEWEEELRGFIENYGFPCVGAWDGFHVYVSTHLKTTLVSQNVIQYIRPEVSVLYINDGEGSPNRSIDLGDDLGGNPARYRFF